MLQKVEKIYWVILLIISFIFWIVIGGVGPNFIHHLIFKHGDTFLVLTPFLSNTFMFIAVGCLIIFFIGMIFEKKVWNLVGISFLIISIFISYYALTRYTLISTHQITFKKNPFTKDSYTWGEINEATFLGPKQDPTRKIRLSFKDEKEGNLEDKTAAYSKWI
ncbi:hypothetical protein [Bacillus sp. SD088]|uniref:hypothetical protein n=1 Tax=Bacillus sp. SD088 TaxID=2782012 RepID=UPI001A968C84|nr:hypothetical protein [Bacillus sp. SD088]MBO0992907.1 hypothetical protein [Bacillus sp. SD088]